MRLLGKTGRMATMQRSIRFGLAAMLSVALIGTAGAANKSKLSTYDSGKPVVGLSCVQPLPTQAAVLVGGGTDVKAAFTWMIEQSRACADGAAPRAGNFVVVRAAGNPDYDRFIYKLGELASVRTIVVPTVDAANSPELDAYIQNASAIWLTGGDQGDYYTLWQGTRLARLIADQVAAHRVPIGGTSAGMMMMSEFNYLATPSTITSAEALANPYKPDATTIANDFWSTASAANPMRAPIAGLENTITDSHFFSRDRMGRLVTFLARIMAADAARYYSGDDVPVPVAQARAIGVDPETALLLQYSAGKRNAVSFTGRTITNPGTTGHAYVLQPTTAPACTSQTAFEAGCGSQPGEFNFARIDVIRSGDGGFIDFRSPNNSTGVSYYGIDVTKNVLTGNSGGYNGLY